MIALDILYVDDDPDIRHIVALSLSRDADTRVRFAACAEDALALLGQGALPDVVLADVMMPGIGGLALADTLRQSARTRDLPLIFVTARAREADMDTYRRHGAIGVIVKPFDALHLADTVRARLAEATNASSTLDDGGNKGGAGAAGKASSTVPGL